jgi:hypothetical protein
MRDVSQLWTATSVTFSVSSNASLVGSSQFTPGTSSIQPIHHGPDCFMTAV